MKKLSTFLSLMTLIGLTYASEKLHNFDEEEKIQKPYNEIKNLAQKILDEKLITEDNMKHLEETVLTLKGLWGPGYRMMVWTSINDKERAFCVHKR
jgi:hypothetical protein